MRRGEVWRLEGLRGDQHVALISSDEARPLIGPPVAARIVSSLAEEPPESMFVQRLSELDPLEGWVFVYSQYQPAMFRYDEGELIGMLTGATLEKIKAALKALYEL